MMRKVLKTIQVLALLLILPAVSQSQTPVSVAEGTSSSNYVPFYLYNAKYAQWTQSIYPSSFLTELVGKRLTAFTYHTATTTFIPDPGTWTVKLAVTTLADLQSGKDNTATTTVFDGSPSFDQTTGDMTFSFDIPFEYDGGNLLVYFDHQANTTTAMNSTTFQSFISDNASRYAYNSAYTSSYNGDGSVSAYLPSIRVSYEADESSETTTTSFVTIDEGSTTSYIIPLQYANAPYAQWTQSIYPASHLTTLVGKQLTSFTYSLIYSNPLPDPGQYTVSLGITTLADLSAGKDTTSTITVFSGTPTINDNQLTFTFSQPFTYTGGNLLVYFDRQTGTTTTAEPIAFNSISHNKGSRSGRNSAYSSDYNTEGTYFDYLPTIIVTSTSDGNAGCDVITLPYTQYFDECPAGQEAWKANAPTPSCWTLYSNGSYQLDPSSESTIYYSGMGTFSIAGTHGAHEADNPYFCFIAEWLYTGNDSYYISDMEHQGTRKFAVLPEFDHPVSQLIVDFDYLTETTGGELSLGYIVNDTSDYVKLLSFASSNNLLQHAHVRIDSVGNNIPSNARLAMLWRGVVTNPYYVSELFCGIDNMVIDYVDVPADTTDVAVDASISMSDIIYWVGSGNNSAIFSVNWVDTALAWGYHFADSTTVEQMMIDIAANDPRFSFTATGFVEDIVFSDSNVELHAATAGSWMSTLNGSSNASIGMATVLHNGDHFKWGDYSRFVTIDTVNWAGIFPDTIYAVSIPPNVDDTISEVAVDATIAMSDIIYWVGSGSNSAIFCVNWADTALAWGYHFTASSTTVEQMMTDIASADPRFSFTAPGSFLSDILFNDSVVELHAITEGWWMSTINGSSAASIGMGTTIHNGDHFKWGDYTRFVTVDFATYAGVFPDTIYAVSIPSTNNDNTPTDTTSVDPQHGPFCGPVGTVGCDAIAADSSAIVGWATGIELIRGPQNISVAGSPLASYGDVDSAIGPATFNNMRAVSLGDGGMAIVTFAHPIRNGEGPDFAVFENGFENYIYGNYSLELAFVEVSTDGERFVRFPATSLTQTDDQTANAGGIDPTMINNLAGKYEVGYGTPFDLEELRDSVGINIDSIVYVRIVDVVGCLNPQYATYDAYGHIVNDPWPTPFASSGFDLTGVAVLHENTDASSAITDATIQASQIRYWVGEGANSVILAVNWVDTALAWGYRFSGQTVTVQDVMHDIATADSRFSYSGEDWLSDIIFVENGQTHHAVQEGWWMSTLNGNSNASMGMTTTLHNGDFFKWGDYNVAVTVDSITYAMVFPDKVYPVSAPQDSTDPQGIDEVYGATVEVYPNPASEVVNVRFAATPVDIQVDMFDMFGRRVRTATVNAGSTHLSFFTDGLANGTYLLRIGENYTKVIIEHR